MSETPAAPPASNKPQSGGRLRGISAKAGQILQGVFSADPSTRKMSWIFILSVLGIFLVIGLGVERLHAIQMARRGKGLSASERDAKHLSEMFKKQADEADAKLRTLSLGTFTIELKRNPADPKLSGVLNIAEIEIILDCDTKETCAFVGQHLPQVKDQVTSVISAVDRERLLARNGKFQIKAELLKKINFWLPHGKIEALYFPKLFIQ